ncbi:N-acyl-D-amino-acid deacylase [Gonapodya prolifera JEL478]|uniref:N-acyl-D-amino-acid deacylase n=1 Tax=Gonapodya prolifera (strain JEL478) TaxID=1344416 RepID=A0A139ATH8_GONPJ|nr:N-acyl-D-amino-acid deacylase [Gonapodya prolifera JEL478]|eukprot:KXS20031.1 N-acyl-D-amino-acid deacylase [Gonapodya prolifera JEL478]
MSGDVEHSILFRNVVLVDGTGSPRRGCDVAVKGDVIVEIADKISSTAKRIIDGKGRLVLCPGFIDTHTHDDVALLSPDGMDCKVSQGVTSVVIGNCGISISPDALADPKSPPEFSLGRHPYLSFPSVATYVDYLEQHKPQTNYGLLVGLLALRCACQPTRDRPANAHELEDMRRLMDSSMRQGAVGFSTGLIYPGQKAAPMEEIVEIAKVTARHGGLYTTHMRDEADNVLTALQEAVDTSRAAEIPLVISHHKVSGKQNWGRSKETLDFLRSAIEAAPATRPIAIDAYPYSASSTILLPSVTEEAEDVLVLQSRPYPDLARKRVSEIVRTLPDFAGLRYPDAVAKLAPGTAIYFCMDDKDVSRILSFPKTMIGSDGLHSPNPHPRLWGTFPRVLGKYARDEGLFGLEEAVRKMTSLSAETFGFARRGQVKAGFFADLVLLDPDEIHDVATFEDSQRPSEGIKVVLVNGEIAWEDGKGVGVGNGRRLDRIPSGAVSEHPSL